MRKKVIHYLFFIGVLFICSLTSVACDAITSQNIPNNGGLSGGMIRKGSPGMNRVPGENPGRDAGGARGSNLKQLQGDLKK